MDDASALAAQIARTAAQRSIRVAAAESLTSGAIASALGAAPDASEWFAGGVVAYSERVKRRVLGVTAESVLTPECARELAEGVVRVLEADAAVAVTGVGGPDPQEGLEPGTVYAAVIVDGRLHTDEWRFEGEPAEVVQRTTQAALLLLRDALA